MGQAGVVDTLHSFSILPLNLTDDLAGVSGVERVCAIISRTVEFHVGDSDHAKAILVGKEVAELLRRVALARLGGTPGGGLFVLSPATSSNIAVAFPGRRMPSSRGHAASVRTAAGNRRQPDGPDPMALTWDEFRRVDIRVGRILTAEDFPEARTPSYKLTVDFGLLGVKRTSAAIRPWYAKGELVGRPIVAVVNFPSKQIANFHSEVLVLGAVQPDGRVILLRPYEEGALGSRVA